MGININRLCPLHDRVLVKRQEDLHKTASGIVIPDAASGKPGHAVKVGGEELLVMRQEDIMAVP